jgi:hypothetical protein
MDILDGTGTSNKKTRLLFSKVGCFLSSQAYACGATSAAGAASAATGAAASAGTSVAGVASATGAATTSSAGTTGVFVSVIEIVC